MSADTTGGRGGRSDDPARSGRRRDGERERIAGVAAPADSEQHARQIIETAYDAFIALDEAGRITEWNAQAGAVFGWSRDEAVGRDLAELLIPQARRQAHRHGIERFLATGEERVLGRRRELMMRHREGYEFLVEVTIAAIRTPHGYTFNAFLRDVTERAAAQEELAQARDAALQASRMKSMFVANVSHEIRTPMNGIIGMTEVLLETELDPRQREFTETISSSGEVLLAIIDDILDMSKIEAGKLELDAIDFDPRDTVEGVCGMLAARAHQRTLELLVAIDSDVPPRVRGDRARLRQVISNLVANAIKFTAAGEVVVSVAARPTNAATVVLRIEVTDTGIGISSEALAHLFKPFAQADGSTTRKYGGTGLGLAISKQLVELMGGQLGASSAPGVGSRFWVELALPVADIDLPAEPRDRLSGLRALVVDDNAPARALLQRQLRDLRMGCDVAADGRAGRELVRAAARARAPYALVLLDAQLPELDRHAVLREVRGAPASPATRIVLLAGAARSPSDHEPTYDGTLAKPVRESRLYQELLTIVLGEQAPVHDSVVPSHHLSLAGSNADVLVVEDGEVNQRVVAHMLEGCGVRAHIAENGRRALEILADRSFAALLMDCQMPELDGYQTTREIRRREDGGRHVPIIAMTANSMEGERERCLAAGMDDYLTKPLHTRTLRDALERWICAPSRVDLDAAAGAGAGAADDHGGGLLDAQLVAELAGLGPDTFEEVLALYFAEVPADIRELAESIGHGDAPAAARAAHKLKGTSATIGAAHVARIAAALQDVAGAGDLVAAATLLGELRRGLQATREALADRAAGRAGGGDGPVSTR